jgi:hypothetical protein
MRKAQGVARVEGLERRAFNHFNADDARAFCCR